MHLASNRMSVCLSGRSQSHRAGDGDGEAEDESGFENGEWNFMKIF